MVKVEAGTSPGGHDWDMIKGMVIVVVVMVEDGMALHLGRDCDNCDNDYGDGDGDDAPHLGHHCHDNDNDVWT